jgi:hypothetical protein
MLKDRIGQKFVDRQMPLGFAQQEFLSEHCHLKIKPANSEAPKGIPKASYVTRITWNSSTLRARLDP